MESSFDRYRPAVDGGGSCCIFCTLSPILNFAVSVAGAVFPDQQQVIKKLPKLEPSSRRTCRLIWAYSCLFCACRRVGTDSTLSLRTALLLSMRIWVVAVGLFVATYLLVSTVRWGVLRHSGGTGSVVTVEDAVVRLPLMLRECRTGVVLEVAVSLSSTGGTHFLVLPPA